jgi:WD40 repeat protein
VGCENERFLALGVSCDGVKVAAGTTNGRVLLLDASEPTASRQLELEVPAIEGLAGGTVGRAHASRVFSVEWHPNDANVLFTGGWDGCVKVSD